MNYDSLFLTICLLWAVSEVLLVIFTRSTSNSKDYDHGWMKWLNIIIYLSIGLAVTIAYTGIGRIHLTILSWVGLSVIVMGLILRWTAILTLRKFFTVNVVIQTDHKIIRKGVYRFIRHPSYTGSIISFIGLGIDLCNWVSALVMIVPIIFAFLKRIQFEEKALQSAFGEEYLNYCKESWCLFPFIY